MLGTVDGANSDDVAEETEDTEPFRRRVIF
jgi:hypothetical protein